MASAPIRQPRGPSSNSFGGAPEDSPPQADTDIRRANSTSSQRHGPSASVSYANSKLSAGRFRSGSLSGGGSVDVGLVRKGSGRESVRPEAPVIEGGEESPAVETGSWGGWSGKGLGRQSSLPSRRGMNPTKASTQAMDPSTMPPPPPRPPRRISVATHSIDITSGQSPPVSAHSVSQSMSSLAAITRQISTGSVEPIEEVASPYMGAGVSRTQSLRAQAKAGDIAPLGRSSSMRTPGEYGHNHHRSMHAMTQAVSPPTQPTTPRNPFTPPTPPPVSSNAALPPYGYPSGDVGDGQVEGADIKRHQSLTQGYGSSSRVRDRLGRSPALLTLEQREDAQRAQNGQPTNVQQPSHTRTLSGIEGPTSPIGHSLWSPSQAREEDGWTRPNIQQMQNAFDAMSLGRRMMGEGEGPLTNGNRQVSSSEEPSWVASLVGVSGEISPQPPARSASAGAGLGRQVQGQWSNMPMPPQPRWPGQIQGDQSFLNMGQQQLGYLQQQQLMAAAYGGLKGPGGVPFPMPQGQPQQQLGGYQQPFQGFIQQPYNNGGLYPNTPVTAPAGGANDAEVLELARKKGLNPATFNCRPQQARFFVIKSYTEEDVQKSLKHEIWSSTVLGNKRLDTAFRESADQMPIYLFFSVNGSRHFCGVAQMLTPVDESQSSTVWAQDKWKGIFKVKWIFVRDVPSPALRHIRLLNTPEQKPITNSRDTQELHYEAGCEVMQIFLDHQNKSKTSLLQDFAYYEQLSANRQNQSQSQSGRVTPVSAQGRPMSAPPSQMGFPTGQPGMQPGMGMGMGGGMGMNMGMVIPMFNGGVPPVPAIPARFR